MIETQRHTRLANGCYRLEGDLYANWTKIEGHAGYVISGLNKQLQRHDLKIVAGQYEDGPSDIYGMVVRSNLPEDQDIEVDIDLSDLKNIRFSVRSV